LNTPLAVIEQATTPHQQIHISTFKNAAIDFAGTTFSSPSLIIVGEVVNLHERFNWFVAELPGSVFQELEK
jgi:uroporphyrin-III C-methyltransferase/precorrin-2 dehydrogenase/sirohydrochlorin ferrochelatase